MSTGTDVAIQPEQQAPLALVPTAPEQVTAALEQWVGGMAASVRGAEYLVDTPMCPDSFWPLPPNVTSSKTPKQPIGNEDRDSYLARRRVATYTLGSVVRYGLQLGLPPEVAVQGIFTIGGRMSMYAEQMVALVKSHGHGHRVIERSRTRCVVEVWRAGETEREQFEFGIDDAIAAGYVPNQGPNAGNHGTWKDGTPKKSPGNAKYLTDPAAMLYARATTIACRIKFPDVLRGLTSYEEVQDEQRSQPVDITATVDVSAPSGARPSAATILGTSEVEPPIPAAAEPPGQQDPAQPAPAPASAQQPLAEGTWRKINARFVELEVVGEGQQAKRLQVISHIVGRPIAKGSEMTASEGQLVLDNLAGDAGFRVLGEALDHAAPAQQPAAVDVTGDADPDGDQDYDPTTEQDWPMEGAEASAEGQQ